MRRILFVLALLAAPASAQVSYYPIGLPSEVDCSDFYGMGSGLCQHRPVYSLQRALPGLLSSTGWYNPAFTMQLLRVTSFQAGTYSGMTGHISTVFNSGALPTGQNASLVGAEYIAYDNSTGTTGTVYTNGLRGMAVSYTSTGSIVRTLVGVHGRAHFIANSGADKASALQGWLYFVDNTPVVGTFAAAVEAKAPDTLTKVGTDITKVYKFYAPSTYYGRNYFGQPEDAGLYAAEIAGAKGLLVGGTLGQLQLSDTGTKPTCDSAHRGSFWYDAGAGGVKDTVEVCAKDAGDAYSWRVIY